MAAKNSLTPSAVSFQHLCSCSSRIRAQRFSDRNSAFVTSTLKLRFRDVRVRWQLLGILELRDKTWDFEATVKYWKSLERAEAQRNASQTKKHNAADTKEPIRLHAPAVPLRIGDLVSIVHNPSKVRSEGVVSDLFGHSCILHDVRRLGTEGGTKPQPQLQESQLFHLPHCEYEIIQTRTPLPPNTPYCDVCNLLFTGPAPLQLAAHLDGGKHAAAVAQQEQIKRETQRKAKAAAKAQSKAAAQPVSAPAPSALQPMLAAMPTVESERPAQQSQAKTKRAKEQARKQSSPSVAVATSASASSAAAACPSSSCVDSSSASAAAPSSAASASSAAAPSADPAVSAPLSLDELAVPVRSSLSDLSTAGSATCIQQLSALLSAHSALGLPLLELIVDELFDAARMTPACAPLLADIAGELISNKADAPLSSAETRTPLLRLISKRCEREIDQAARSASVRLSAAASSAAESNAADCAMSAAVLGVLFRLSLVKEKLIRSCAVRLMGHAPAAAAVPPSAHLVNALCTRVTLVDRFVVARHAYGLEQARRLLTLRRIVALCSRSYVPISIMSFANSTLPSQWTGCVTLHGVALEPYWMIVVSTVTFFSLGVAWNYVQFLLLRCGCCRGLRRKWAAMIVAMDAAIPRWIRLRLGMRTASLNVNTVELVPSMCPPVCVPPGANVDRTFRIRNISSHPLGEYGYFESTAAWDRFLHMNLHGTESRALLYNTDGGTAEERCGSEVRMIPLGTRFPVPADVAVFATVDVPITVTAPMRPGLYYQELRALVIRCSPVRFVLEVSNETLPTVEPNAVNTSSLAESLLPAGNDPVRPPRRRIQRRVPPPPELSWLQMLLPSPSFMLIAFVLQLAHFVYMCTAIQAAYAGAEPSLEHAATYAQSGMNAVWILTSHGALMTQSEWMAALPATLGVASSTSSQWRRYEQLYVQLLNSGFINTWIAMLLAQYRAQSPDEPQQADTWEEEFAVPYEYRAWLGSGPSALDNLLFLCCLTLPLLMLPVLLTHMIPMMVLFPWLFVVCACLVRYGFPILSWARGKLIANTRGSFQDMILVLRVGVYWLLVLLLQSSLHYGVLVYSQPVPINGAWELRSSDCYLRRVQDELRAQLSFASWLL